MLADAGVIGVISVEWSIRVRLSTEITPQSSEIASRTLFGVAPVSAVIEGDIAPNTSLGAVLLDPGYGPKPGQGS